MGAATLGPDLPTVTLDHTLADLYRMASPSNAHKKIAQVLCGVNSALELSKNFPRNTKYLYQDSPFNTVEEKVPTTPGASAQLQRDLAMKYLSLIPQRDAFISGDTPVVLFHLNETHSQVAHDRREADATLSVLNPDQRPRLVFCAGPAQIPIEEAGIDLIAYKLVLDGLDSCGYNLIVNPDTHWLLNSKVALAQSGLPTPRADVLVIEGHAEDARECCNPCLALTEIKSDVPGATSFVIPEACEGSRGQWFREQSQKIYDTIAQRPLPFVLKNQQTFGGAGTYLVRTEKERNKVLADLRDGILRRLYSSVTPENAYLRPASLLLSELVANPIGDYGLTFFVTDKDGGEPIFLAASEQMIQNGNAWVGSKINYKRQTELKAKFGKLVTMVAAWLREQGYVGPAGADVLETEPVAKNGESVNVVGGQADDDMACFHVVDLNVRTSGSLALPLMKTHFTSRGLQSASSFSISVRRPREEFIRDFWEDFESGRMCIISWYEDPDSDLSLADVAVGAENDEQLAAEMERVKVATDGITF